MKFLTKFLVYCALIVVAAKAVTAAEPTAASRGEPLVVDAEKLQFDRQTNLAVGEGNVVARYKGAVMRADRIRYNSATKDVWAEGNVRLNRGDQEWVSPALYYNFETRALQTDLARGVVEKIFVRADKVSSTVSNRTDITAVTLTTCDYDHPHYRLEAKRGEIFGNERVALYNVTVRLGDVPVFWLPVVLFSLQADTQPISLSLGHSGRWGFYVLTTTQWQLNDHMGLGVHLDGRTARGAGVGADLKYRYKNTTGLLGGYFIDDADPDEYIDLLAGKDLSHNRYTARWEHKQLFADDLSLTINLNKQGDTDVMQDFFSQRYQREFEPTSVIDGTWRAQYFTLSALVQPQLNSFYAEVERLPELKLSVNRLRLWNTPLYYEGETSAGYYNNERGDTGDPLFTGFTSRASTFHQVVVPHTFWDWLSVVPRAGIRGTWYERAPDTAPETNEVTRGVFNLGLEVSTKFWRRWDGIQLPKAGIDGLRHIVQPFANYQWVPRPDVAPSELHQFDTYRYATLTGGGSILASRFVPIDFAANSAIDAYDRENVLRFGLRQKLQTRREGMAWDLVDLEGWTDWRMERENGESEFGDFFGVARLRPTDWLRGDIATRYDISEGRLRELNTAMHLQHRDRWSFGLGTRFLDNDSNLLTADIAFRLARHWTMQTYQRFDMQDGQWEEQEYVLRQETHDWFINYGVRLRGERVGEDEVTVFFAVTLKAFPGVRLSVN